MRKRFCSEAEVVVGLVFAGVTWVLYYPAVVAVGLLSYFTATPPPVGPLPSETRLRDTALHVLSYPSQLLAAPARGSVWSGFNPLVYSIAIGVSAGLLVGLVSLIENAVVSGKRRRNGGESVPPPGSGEAG